MTPFATRLAAKGLITNDEAFALSSVEYDYSKRLDSCYFKRVWRPMVEADNEVQLTAAAEEVARILSFAKDRASIVTRARTYIEAAEGEVYRRVTLQWYVHEVQPLIKEFLSDKQVKRLDALVLPLHQKRGGRNA